MIISSSLWSDEFDEFSILCWALWSSESLKFELKKSICRSNGSILANPW
jgi:hypothetical protein